MSELETLNLRIAYFCDRAYDVVMEYLSGNISDAAYKTRMNHIDRMIAELEAREQELQNESASDDAEALTQNSPALADI